MSSSNDAPNPGHESAEALERIRDLLYGDAERAVVARLSALEQALDQERKSTAARHTEVVSQLEALAARIEDNKVDRRDLADLLGGIADKLSGKASADR